MDSAPQPARRGAWGSKEAWAQWREAQRKYDLMAAAWRKRLDGDPAPLPRWEDL